MVDAGQDRIAQRPCPNVGNAVDHENGRRQLDDDGDRSAVAGRVVGVTGVVGGHVVGADVDLVGRAGAIGVGRVG